MRRRRRGRRTASRSASSSRRHGRAAKRRKVVVKGWSGRCGRPRRASMRKTSRRAAARRLLCGVCHVNVSPSDLDAAPQSCLGHSAAVATEQNTAATQQCDAFFSGKCPSLPFNCCVSLPALPSGTRPSAAQAALSGGLPRRGFPAEGPMSSG